MYEIDIFTAMAITALVCFPIAFAVTQIKSTILYYLIALLVPFFISNILYWSACLFETECSEYTTWFILFFVPTFLSGVLSMFLGLYILKRLGK